MNEKIIKDYLTAIGEDPTREGLVDTPKRVVNMWREIFAGYNAKAAPKITTFLNGADGIIYNQMILDSGEFYSHCEHHIVPFFGTYLFAYIPSPKGRLLGLSKVARVVDYHASKLQVQERLTHDIVDTLWSALNYKHKPLGMGLILKGQHLCKTMRGAKKKGEMTTIKLKGRFLKDDKVKSEFLNFSFQC